MLSGVRTLDIRYHLIYSKRKTVGLSIKDGELVVRAPRGTGVTEIERVIKKHERWIVTHIAREIENMEKQPTLTSLEEEKLKAQAKVYFKETTDRYSKIMNLSYGRIKITSARKRFGSCNSKGTVCFSYRLMLYPEAAREYVVVHELAHLLELNHSRRFYSIVEKYMPDYRERKKLLSH